MAEHKSPVDFEKRDIQPGTIVRAAIAVAVVAVVAALAVLGLLKFFGESAREAEPLQGPLARQEQGRVPPGPRLQEQPFKDVKQLHAEEQAILSSAAWLDSKAGIARIPVDEAMKMVAAKGLPSWPMPSPSPGASPAAPAGGAR